MELTQRHMRRLRRTVARPIYPLDHALIKASAEADTAGMSIYAAIRNPATHLIYRYLTEFAIATLELHADKPVRQLKILDWGGGKGYVAYLAQQKGAQATLFETTDFPHQALWKRFTLDVQTSSGATLPFADKTFDAVVGFGVLEHVPYDLDALKEVNRVLKDDGLFFCFNLPNKLGYVHKVTAMRGVRYHDRLYTPGEVRELLKRSGFNTVGRPWYRQLLPKTHYQYPHPRLIEQIDLLATTYTPLKYLAASIEFVARKQYAYTARH